MVYHRQRGVLMSESAAMGLSVRDFGGHRSAIHILFAILGEEGSASEKSRGLLPSAS